MLECAIPNCGGRERSLCSGTLHLADIVRNDGSSVKKMIWLCAGCTRQYLVQTWRPAGEQIRLRTPSAFNPADLLSMRLLKHDAPRPKAVSPRRVTAQRTSPGRHEAA